MSARFAVGFKTHVWDAFVARQFDRIVASAKHCDVTIIADETRGSLGPIDHDKVIRTCDEQLVRLGLADAYPKGSLIWWNTDYPHYLLYRAQPTHEQYLFVEYDCRINRPIDGLFDDIAARQLDLVALPIRQGKDTWYWTRFHERCYPYHEIRGSLNCIAAMSNRALRLLFDRRREMTQAYQAGQFDFWPGFEVFVATEIARAGYRFASLEEFGDCSAYDWHPPHLDEDLPVPDGRTFLHPVLDRKRYIRSLLKFEFDLSAYLLPGSGLHRRLRRFPARDYVPLLAGAFRDQVMVKVKQGILGHV